MAAESENDPRKEASLREQATQELTALRSGGQTSSVLGLANGNAEISLDSPDEEIISVLVSNLKYNERLAAEVPENIEELTIQALPKPPYESTLNDFVQWYLKQNSFWTDRVGAKADVSKLERDAKWQLYGKFADVFWQNVLKQAFGERAAEFQDIAEERNISAPDRLEKIYRQALTLAVENNQSVPQEVFESFRNLPRRQQEFYLKLEKKAIHKKIASQEKGKINQEIVQKISDNFNNLYLQHGRNDKDFMAAFKVLLPDVEMEFNDRAFTFKDNKTNLVYVAIPSNSMLGRTWQDFFGKTPTNAPIKKLTRPAVVIKETATDANSSFVLIQAGEVTV
jgi:hypothetical protein